jgi:hypothetical protein
MGGLDVAAGVKKMKIAMDEEAGAHLDIPIERVNIHASLGSQGRTAIEIGYV